MLKTFKVNLTDGSHYLTQANGTAKSFETYLKQDGGRIVDENQLTGVETVKYIDTVQEWEPCLVLVRLGDRRYRCTLEAYHGDHCKFEEVK